jgi:hypothetical protein
LRILAKTSFIKLIKVNLLRKNSLTPSFCGTFKCPQLFEDAFTKNFQTLGLQVVKNINEAQAVMKGKILRFEFGWNLTYGLTGSSRAR